ncbi:MAG: hypothetical protein HOI09_07455 [Porticoccaceae bacterium]|nr:hypothetical protein [Porticoccaceae bacterium]
MSRTTLELTGMGPVTTEEARLAAERLEAKEKLAAESRLSKQKFERCYNIEGSGRRRPWISQADNDAHAMRLNFLRITMMSNGDYYHVAH